MTNQEYAAQCEYYADCEREAGGSIDIGPTGIWVSITLSDGSEYFFQDHEADKLLDEVPDYVNREDYLLATAQNW